MVQLVIQPREPFEPGFLRRPGTFFYARLKRLAKLVRWKQLNNKILNNKRMTEDISYKLAVISGKLSNIC